MYFKIPYMEVLGDVIDAETLKRHIDIEAVHYIDMESVDTSLLYPSIPYGESKLEHDLSLQFIGHNEVGNYRSKLLKYTFDLDLGLSHSKSKKSEGHPKVELDLNLLNQLLSNQPCYRLDGRKVDDAVIKGKYVLACSLSVPDFWDSPAWELAVKSNELCNQRPNDFQMIIVAKLILNDGWDKYADLDTLFKHFHMSCVVIPLHSEIEASLNLHALEDGQALVIAPNSEVIVDSHIGTLCQFGSDAFPFTCLSTLTTEYHNLKPTSLESFLGLNPSFQVFRKIPETEPLQEEFRSISLFKSKIVFLYLYCYGDELPSFYNTVVALREKGLEFEVLTAYVPSTDFHNPLQFQNVFSTLVARRGLSCWVVPYYSSMYPRLSPSYSHGSDKLIVFDPKFNEGDPHGFQVLSLYGESMFPFMKMSVVEHVMKDLSQVTLRFLLDPITRLYKEDQHYDGDEGEDKSVLDGKNVFVFFETFVEDSFPVFKSFKSWCMSLEAKKRNFEVVFVSLNPQPEPHGPYFNDFKLPFPRWLVPRSEEVVHSKYVVDNLFLKLFKREFPTVVAFGKDGKLCSLRAHILLSSLKAAAFFDDGGDLPGEVFCILDDYFIELLDVY